MKIDHPALSLPIHLKLTEDQEWPKDKAFYYLTKDGVFLCRNHPFFSSSSKVEKMPKGLASHKGVMHLNFPLVSRTQFEQIVGFFDAIWKKYNSEAAVLLIWNTETQQVEILCPPQEATVGSGYTDWKGQHRNGSPMDVKYEIPQLPPHKMVFGDIHSHVEMSAFASGMDQADEKNKPGVHIVVGYIDKEPPQFHIESTADGERFMIASLSSVVDGYGKRRMDFPPEWIDQVKCITYKYTGYSGGGHGYGGGEGCYQQDWYDRREVRSGSTGDPDAGEWVKKADGTWVKQYPEKASGTKAVTGKKQLKKLLKRIWKRKH